MRWLWSVVVVIAVVSGCGADGVGEAPAATARLEVTALAGPTCPVETDPPSPDCTPRPVEGAVIVVTDSGGTEVARGTTGSDGQLIIAVAPGGLLVVPQPVDGLLGTAPVVTVTVAAGQTLRVTADYDTGIR